MTAYRVLVVDDDPVHREIVTEYMAAAGYTIEAAPGGLEALELMRAEVPDLVLLDVQMPDLDGFGVCRRMREDRRLRDVVVMFLSSQQAAHVKVRGLELGADDYVGKDCTPAELLARVRGGLRRATRYRQLQSTFSGVVGDDLGLDALLQTVQIGMRSARIQLLDLPAEIVCGQGEVRASRFRSFVGSRALQRVFVRPSGRFAVDMCDAADCGGEPLTLMEALVAVDEARSTLAELAPRDAVLASGAGPIADVEIERRRGLLPLPATELLVLLDGDIRAVAGRIAGALREGSLVVAG